MTRPHLWLALGLLLFAAEGFALGHPIGAAVNVVGALINIAAALWPADEER